MGMSKIGDTTLLKIFGILGTIVIGTIFSYQTLPQWSIYIVILLLLIMLCILVWISSLPEHISKRSDMRRHNKLAKKFFQEFKEENFVDSFKKIQSYDPAAPNQEYTFHNIVDRLKRDHQEFESLPDPEINLIRNHFTFWLRWYGYFDGKIDFNSFSTMLEDFSSMVKGYHRICNTEPLRIISRINEINQIKINEKRKKDWKIAVGYYDDFEKRYNHFVGEVNGEFKDTILSGLPPAQEL